MKKKIILMIVILCVMLLGVINVKAADDVEYKPGDLVELINPIGGESLRFYIEPAEEEGEYLLFSAEPIAINKTVKELDTYTSDELFLGDKAKYILDIEKTIENNKYLLIQELNSAQYVCLDKSYASLYDNLEEVEGSYYFNCQRYKGMFDNSFFLILNEGENEVFSYFEISDDPNYDFVIRSFNGKLNEIKETETKKLDYYLTLSLSEENLNLIRKADEQKEIPTTTITTITTEAPVSNPKTDDININVFAIILILCAGIILIAKKKLYNKDC